MLVGDPLYKFDDSVAVAPPPNAEASDPVEVPKAQENTTVARMEVGYYVVYSFPPIL